MLFENQPNLQIVSSLRAQCMISKAMSNHVQCDSMLSFSSKQFVISLAFCDMWNNQGLGKRYQP